MKSREQSGEERGAFAPLPGGGYGVTVLFELEDGAFEKFYPLVCENAEKSVVLESACLRFDVLTPTAEGRANEVFLYEIYADRAAFELHLASAHFKSFDESSRDLVRSKTVLTFSVEQNFKDRLRA